MRGSLQVARLFGIPVKLHWTFLFIFLWLGFTSYSQGWDMVSTFWAFAFLLSLFVCVVLHEFGHALTARRYGVNTRDIILSPIGGVARLDHLPENPWQELMVAIAGPLVNVAIGVVIAGLALLFSPTTGSHLINLYSLLTEPEGNVFTIGLSAFDYFLLGLIGLNLLLAVFNMLPAFPMDGGRVLRALLSMRLSRYRATQIAAYVGQAIAVLLVMYGVYTYSFITAFIGIFVFISAANEYRMVRFDQLLKDHTVADVIRTSFTPVYQKDTLSSALNLAQSGLEKHFLVLDEWQQVVGVLPEEQLLEAVKQLPPDTTSVGNVSIDRYPSFLPQDSLKEIFTQLQQGEMRIAPVYDNGELIGVVDQQTVYSFLDREEKMRKGKRAMRTRWSREAS